MTSENATMLLNIDSEESVDVDAGADPYRRTLNPFADGYDVRHLPPPVAVGFPNQLHQASSFPHNNQPPIHNGIYAAATAHGTGGEASLFDMDDDASHDDDESLADYLKGIEWDSDPRSEYNLMPQDPSQGASVDIERVQLYPIDHVHPNVDVGNLALGRDDILMGRGSRANNHPGNIWFRDLIARSKPTYVTLHNSQKHQFTMGIFNNIRREGRRFLREGITIHEIPDDEAQSKISQRLRDA